MYTAYIGYEASQILHKSAKRSDVFVFAPVYSKFLIAAFDIKYVNILTST